MSDQDAAEHGVVEKQIDEVVAKASAVLTPDEIALLRWATGTAQPKRTTRPLYELADDLAF